MTGAQACRWRVKREDMMRYALLIHVDEGLWNRMSQEEQGAVMGEYGAFGERYKDKIRGGDALRGVATATTVRVREGQTLTTDGPFAETKEQLNGFYIVDCDNLDGNRTRGVWSGSCRAGGA